MDDLSGLSWTSSPNDAPKQHQVNSAYMPSSMRLSPVSGQSTPRSGAGMTTSNPTTKPTTPANDSFANLVSFGSGNNSNKNLSLLEQQKRLQEQKAKEEAERRAQLDAQFGGSNAQFWDSIERNEPTQRQGTGPNVVDEDEDDLLAAFNASAPVDRSSHLPVPTSDTPSTSELNGQGADMTFNDDDDPFGLGQMTQNRTATTQPSNQNDDDDFLGLLGKPVSELPPREDVASRRSSPAEEVPPKPTDPRDRAIAAIVDMGFPAEKAREALDHTESGVDVQAAVTWLLNQAHAESRERARAADNAQRGRTPGSRERSTAHQGQSERTTRVDLAFSDENRESSRHHTSHEKDVSEIAARFGNQFLKTANNLWKTGSRRVQQVVQEFNADVDPSKPRWMREATSANLPSQQLRETSRGERGEEQVSSETAGGLTEEALLLEMGTGPPPRQPPRPKADATGRSRHPVEHPVPSGEPNETRTRFVQHREEPQHLPQRQQKVLPQHNLPSRDPKSRLTREALEKESAQAYVSPARRRRQAQQQVDTSIDLLEDTNKPSKPATPPTQPPRPAQPPANLPSRPKQPQRTIPPVSDAALSASHKDRERGNEAYKRGDFAAAHEAFAMALSHLPNGHPVTILALSNRAMTALKIGEPKSAIADADTILSIIGVSKGEGEYIDPGNGQPQKPMRDFYGKALMRKAEALEQLEKWADAAQVWRQAVEAGHGGSTSIQGRNRCEKAAGISKPTPTSSKSSTPRPAPKKTSAPPPRRSALDDLAGSKPEPVAATEAVNRLRAANDAADRAEEERLALTDTVDAKIMAWKGGKQDNLRALLASLDTVLWPEAGWKKINLSELVLPSKVKVQYMKGIAKVHPDKVSHHSETVSLNRGSHCCSFRRPQQQSSG